MCWSLWKQPCVGGFLLLFYIDIIVLGFLTLSCSLLVNQPCVGGLGLFYLAIIVLGFPILCCSLLVIQLCFGGF